MAKVAFLQNIEYEYLGTAMLSAILKKSGHFTKLFFTFERDLIKSLRDYNPDIVCFAITTGQHEEPLKMIRVIKENINPLIVVGGPHPTYFHEIINEDVIDVVIRGEAENALLMVSNEVDGKRNFCNIPNTIVKINNKIIENKIEIPVSDLDTLPYPDRELYYEKSKYLKSNPHKAFITSRGCPFLCTFCFEPTYNEMITSKKQLFRRYSVNRAIDEIKSVVKTYGAKTIRFSDDVFTLNQKWSQEFCKRYSLEVGLPFYCITRADCLNEETIKLLKIANCRALYFGIESGNDYIRNDVLKKNLSRKAILNAANLLHKHDIKFGTFNMLGNPNETIENAFETINLNVEIMTDYPYCSIVQPYPKTGLYEYAKENGLLPEAFTFNSIDASFFNSSVLKNPQAKELVNLHKLFWLAVKIPKLRSLIRKSIGLSNNGLYNLIFKISFGIRYMDSSGISLLRVIQTSRRMAQHFSKKS